MIQNFTNELFIVENLLNDIKTDNEINNCEYIYIEDIDLQDVNNPFLKNKIIITRKINDYYMFENTNITTKPKMTKLNYNHIVDLLILNNQAKNYANLEEIMDEDTILLKNLGNNVLYIEDIKKQIKIILTPYEKIILSKDGINTQMRYYEIVN